MAEFLTAYKITAKWEGGYSNVSNDLGGITYCGISRKFHPNWKGWAIVDKYKPLKHNQIIEDTQLQNEVRQFYYYNFWLNISAEFIESQSIANFVYDWHVNSGNAGIRAIQRALKLKPDGIVGSKTIEALNKSGLCKLIQARIDFVNAIVKRSPSQAKFLDGWLNRIRSFDR